MFEPLIQAVQIIPAGRCAVAVSGGADSVALLHLFHHHRPHLHLHVVHLDHQTRGAESTGDAEFVRQLAADWQLPHTIARRDEIEPMLKHRPKNRSALYRALRHELFRRVVEPEKLDAVLLAHHADDQAETVLHRLLRGGGIAGCAGMRARTKVGGLVLIRPLLDFPRQFLRDYLRGMNLTWREDSSNASDKYFRNRLRKLLDARPQLKRPLVNLGQSAADLKDWIRSVAPKLGESFAVEDLRKLPRILAEESARRWLIAQDVPPGQITAATLDQLIEMATDAATAPRQHFPGRALVIRRGGRISALRAS